MKTYLALYRQEPYNITTTEYDTTRVYYFDRIRHANWGRLSEYSIRLSDKQIRSLQKLAVIACSKRGAFIMSTFDSPLIKLFVCFTFHHCYYE